MRPDSKSRPRAAILAYDGLCTFEFGIAVELFALPRPELPIPWFETRVVGIDGPRLRALGGIVVEADAGLDTLETVDLIVVPGWRDPERPPPEATLDILRRAHARGTTLLTICSGVFVAAATGLLAGKPATTHWRYGTTLRRRHPEIDFQEDVLYVDTGGIITSAGSAAGIDAGLHYIRRTFGAEIANRVARRLVAAPHRDGGQAQFVPGPVAPASPDRLARTLEWAQGRLGSPLRVPDMAAHAHMSERTFLRRFRDATGTTPHKWLRRARIAAAQGMLEANGTSVEEIALQCGFETPESFRTAFRAVTGLSPLAYRRRFTA